MHSQGEKEETITEPELQETKELNTQGQAGVLPGKGSPWESGRLFVFRFLSFHSPFSFFKTSFSDHRAIFYWENITV